MKRVIIDIDDNYADVLTVSAVGGVPRILKVSTAAVNLNEHDYFRIDSLGYIKFDGLKEEQDG